MKTLDLIKKANKNLMVSKTRTILTILSIIIGAFVITLTMSLSNGANDFIQKQFSSIKMNHSLMIRAKGGSSAIGITLTPAKYSSKQNHGTLGISFINKKQVNIIKHTHGIEKVVPLYLPEVKYITGKNNIKYQFSVANYMGNFFSPSLEAGRLPTSNNGNYIIIPSMYVKPLGFSSANDAIGKKVTITYKNLSNISLRKSYIIKGVLVNSVILNYGYISTQNAKSITKFEDKGTNLANSYIEVVGVYNKDLSKNQINKIKSHLGKNSLSALTYKDEIKTINYILLSIEAILTIFALIALFVASFGIINTLFMSVYQRTREIGLMKAIGMSSIDIFKLFSFEAISIGFWGGIIGSFLAVVVGNFINKAIANSILKSFPGYKLLVFSPVQIIWIIVFLMIVGFIAGTIPAIKASRLNPIDALRYE